MSEEIPLDCYVNPAQMPRSNIRRIWKLHPYKMDELRDPKGDLIFEVYAVPSFSRDGIFHHVVKYANGAKPTCTCESYHFRGRCKHIDDVFDEGIYNQANKMYSGMRQNRKGVGAYYVKYGSLPDETEYRVLEILRDIGPSLMTEIAEEYIHRGYRHWNRRLLSTLTGKGLIYRTDPTIALMSKYPHKQYQTSGCYAALTAMGEDYLDTKRYTQSKPRRVLRKAEEET